MIQIKDKSDCCGCSACVSICNHNAINFKSDEEGFLYPHINKTKCIDCGLCNIVCPVLSRKADPLTSSTTTTLNYYAIRHKDKNVLETSSSGGAFSLLADWILSRNGVVCGVEYSSTGKVQHAFVEKREDICKLRGSKYVQSDISGIYNKIKTILKQDRYVLFSGTPCQVDGLKKFLRKDYEKMLTVDLVCHSIPSPLIFKEYLELASKKLKNKVLSIDMRYKKTYGWSHRYSYRFNLENGKNVVDPLWIVNWGRLFFSELTNRPSCGECQYTNFNRPGDFTIADFWDDEHKRPDIYSKEGTSLLLVNSDKSKNILDEIASQCRLWEITKDEALQPCLLHTTKQNPLRDEFWEYYYKFGFEKTYKRFFAENKITLIKKIIKFYLAKVKSSKNNL